MSMPEGVKRFIQKLAEEQAAATAKAKQSHVRVLDALITKGLRLSPAGINAVVGAANAIAQYSHVCSPGSRCESPAPELAIEILDEFILTWAIHRLAEDPNAIEHARMEILPDTARLFLGETARVRITGLTCARTKPKPMRPSWPPSPVARSAA